MRVCGEAGGGREGEWSAGITKGGRERKWSVGRKEGGRREYRENGGREGGRAVSCAREETPHQSYRLGPSALANTLSLLLCMAIVCTLSIV